MNTFQIGDKVRIIDPPAEGQHLTNKIGTICPIGGHGYEDDDVCMKLEEGGSLILIKEDQLARA